MVREVAKREDCWLLRGAAEGGKEYMENSELGVLSVRSLKLVCEVECEARTF